VSVEFSVTLPADTPEDAGIRMYGSAYQLGARISGNDLNTPAIPGMNVPVMERDGNHATLTLQLFEGMHIAYHYSLSTWSYGSERNNDSQMVDRTLVVSAATTQQADWIICWGAPGMTRLSIYVTTPSSTPVGVPIALENGPSHWMTQVASNRWAFYVYGNPGDSFIYHYVLGGDMDGMEAGDPTRTVAFGLADTVIENTISSWAYIPDDWGGSEASREASDQSTPLTPPDFICGYYPVDYWWQSFVPLLSTTFDRIRAHNGTWVAVSSVWSYGQVSPVPTVEPRPLLAYCGLTPREVLVDQIKEAHAYGLQVLLAPQFNMEMTPGGESVCGSHSDEWWDGWIVVAREMWMWNAQLAQETGAEALLLPGYCFHAFPPTYAFSGAAEAQAFDEAVQSLIAEVRTVFHGSLLIGEPGTDFGFPSLVDWIGITTYTTGHPNLPTSASVEEWQAAYDSLFMTKLDPLYTKYQKPIIVYQVQVPSAASPDDLTGEQAQARQLDGLMQALHKRSWVVGTFSFAYTMIDVPLKPSDGIRARQGEEILQTLYDMETSAVFRVTSKGNVCTDGAYYGASFNSGSADVAEWVPVSEPVEPGDVLELDPDHPGHYRKSLGPCSDLVAGVVSTDPGFVLGSSSSTLDSGHWTDNSALLALIGIVPVKVTDEGGLIQPGDLLVASSTAGYAMHWDPEDRAPCALVGKALESMSGSQGVILVLLTVH